MIDCPSQSMIAEFRSGTLAEEELHDLADHLAVCESCQQVYESQGDAFEKSLVQNDTPYGLSTQVDEQLDEFRFWVRNSLLWGARPTGIDHAATQRESETSPTPSFDFSGKQIGKYLILEQIGRGGMGRVFKAFDPDLNEEVCIKILHAGVYASDQELGYFRRELSSLAQVRHDHVVPVYFGDVDHDPPYVVMRLLRGGTLRQKAKTMSRRELISTMITVCRAIGHIHRCKLIHRDIKPENILFDESDQPNISDFGLAKPLPESATHATQSFAGSGTPPYMAPEQTPKLPDAPVTPATDVWGLGVVLYELLAGRRPFVSSFHLKLFEKICLRTPTEPASIDPSIDPTLNSIVMKCLEKSPTNRFESADQLADELQLWYDGQETQTLPLTFWARRRRWARLHPTKTVAIALTMVVSCAIGILLLGNSGLPHKWAQQARFIAGQDVELIGANSRPAWSRQIVEESLQEAESQDGFFAMRYLSEPGLIVYESTPGTPIRFTTQLRHDSSERAGSVGIWIVFCRARCDDGEVLGAVAINYNDRISFRDSFGFDPPPEIPPGNGVTFDVTLLDYRSSRRHRFIRSDESVGTVRNVFGSIPNFRELTLETDGQTLSGYFDGELCGEITFEELNRQFSERLTEEGVTPLDIEQRQDFGFFILQGSASARLTSVHPF